MSFIINYVKSRLSKNLPQKGSEFIRFQGVFRRIKLQQKMQPPIRSPKIEGPR